MGDGTAIANFIGLTAEIVSAYVSNNTVPSGDIPALINQVHSALLRVSSGQGEALVRAAEAGGADQAVDQSGLSSSVWRTARNSSRSSAICARSTT